MSTSPQLEGGGDDTDGTDDGSTTDGDRSEHRRGVTLTSSDGSATITLPTWIFQLRPLLILVERPRAFIVAAIVGISITEASVRLARGESAAAIIIEDYLFRQVLVPAGAGLLGFLAGIVNGVLGVFVFLANIPLGLAGLSAQGIAASAGGIAGSIRAFNLGLVEPVTALGVGAQPAATAIGVGQFALAGYLGWILIRSIDVPFIQPVNALLAFMRPIRNALGGLFGR